MGKILHTSNGTLAIHQNNLEFLVLFSLCETTFGVGKYG